VIRVGIDGRELNGKATGVGRYLTELLVEWSTFAAPDAWRFTLFSDVPERAVAPRVRELLARRGETFVFEAIAGGHGTWWEQVTLARAVSRRGLDLFFAPAYSAPLAIRPPIVLTIHDLSFQAHPEWFGWREGLRRRWLTRRSAERAALVLTDSEFSRREIVERLGIPAARARAIRIGARPGVSAAAPEADRGLVLFVGSVLERRHVPELIEAFARVARANPGLRLAIVGENRTRPPIDLRGAAERLGVAARVDVHEYVDDGDLERLYARARAFVFLSEYEGFGLTPLEALAAGVPPLVLDTPVAREVYGEAAAYVPSFDRGLVAASLERVLYDEATRARILGEAPATLARYSWPAAARETLEALAAVANACSISRS
jgi:glycosyltransferase involved in cell wall biosynthesis